MSKYCLVRKIPAASAPITLNKKFDAFKPNNVTKMEINKAKIRDCAIYIEAILVFFSPKEFPIKAFVPAPTPTPTAIIVKYIGKDLAIAPIASAEILPANQVSTKL